MTTTEPEQTEEAAQPTLRVVPTPLDRIRGDAKPKPVLDTSEPVLPDWLRSRSGFVGVLGLFARRNTYRLRHWSWNLPIVLALLVLYSPRGLWRVSAQLGTFLYHQDSAELQHEARGKSDDKAYNAIERTRKAKLRARWLVVATIGVPVLVPILSWTYPHVLSGMVGLLAGYWLIKIIPGRKMGEVVAGVCLALAIWYWLPDLLERIPRPPFWPSVAILAGAVLALGWIGRPRGRAMAKKTDLSAAGIPEKPSKEMVVDALCRIGLPGMTLQTAERVHQEVRIMPPGVATSAHGYVVEMELPPGRTAEEVAGKRDSLAGALRRDLGCVWPSGNPEKHPSYLRLFLSHRPMNTGRQPNWPLMAGKEIDVFDPIPLFTDEEMRWVALTLAGTHTAVGGASGFGKSVWLRQLVCALAFDPRVRLVVFDGKRSGDLDCVRKVAHAFHEGAEPEEIEDMLEELRGLVREYSRRSKFLKNLPADERSPKVTSALATKYPKDLSPIVVICDEVQEGTEYGTKTSKEDKAIREEFVSLLTRLSRVGRSAGIFLVLASQKPDAGVIPSSIMGNCSIRIAFKVSEQTHNDQILGTSARKNGIDATMFGARDRGMAWLKGGDNVDAQVVRSWSKLAHPTEGLVLAGELVDKAHAIRERKGLLTGLAAGEVTEDDEVPVDVIADALSIIDSPAHGGRNISLVMLAEKLRELRPTTWAKLDQTALGALLRPKHVTVDSVWCPAEGRSMQGVKREWLIRGDDTGEGGEGTPTLSVVR